MWGLVICWMLLAALFVTGVIAAAWAFIADEEENDG